jgi:hypothetical protein
MKPLLHNWQAWMNNMQLGGRNAMHVAHPLRLTGTWPSHIDCISLRIPVLHDMPYYALAAVN